MKFLKYVALAAFIAACLTIATTLLAHHEPPHSTCAYDAFGDCRD